MKKLSLILIILCFCSFFANAAFADTIVCSMTLSFQKVTEEAKSSADTPDICFQNALRNSCRNICSKKKNHDDSCQSNCFRTATLSSISCTASRGGNCSVDIERNRKQLLSPSAKATAAQPTVKPGVGSSALLLSSNQKHKTNAKRSDYLILDRKAAKKAPLINTTSYYAKPQNRYGNVPLLKPATSAPSREQQSNSATILNIKKKRIDKTKKPGLLR